MWRSITINCWSDESEPVLSSSCRISSQSTRSVTSRVRLRIQRICPRSPTLPKTSSPVTTTATSSLLSMWSVPTLCFCVYRPISNSLSVSCSYLCLLSPPCQNLAYEIILTLGQAFEVAYQLALQARKSGHGSSTLPESFDSKPNKPVPKPRVNIRKSVSCTAAEPPHSRRGNPSKSIQKSNSRQQTQVVLNWISISSSTYVIKNRRIYFAMDFHLHFAAQL